MKIVIDATEPLDIRPAREDEEGFEVREIDYFRLRLLQSDAAKLERHIVRQVINDYPDHPDVPYLREYLKEEG